MKRKGKGQTRLTIAGEAGQFSGSRQEIQHAHQGSLDLTPRGYDRTPGRSQKEPGLRPVLTPARPCHAMLVGWSNPGRNRDRRGLRLLFTATIDQVAYEIHPKIAMYHSR